MYTTKLSIGEFNKIALVRRIQVINKKSFQVRLVAIYWRVYEIVNLDSQQLQQHILSSSQHTPSKILA